MELTKEQREQAKQEIAQLQAEARQWVETRNRQLAEMQAGLQQFVTETNMLVGAYNGKIELLQELAKDTSQVEPLASGSDIQ